MPSFLYALDYCAEILEDNVSIGTFYRAVHSEGGLTPDDFKPKAVLVPNSLKTAKNNRSKCLLYGISLFGSVKKLQEKQNQTPNMGRFIVSATLSKDAGILYSSKFAHTKHADWYPYANIKPHEIFSYIETEHDTP